MKKFFNEWGIPLAIGVSVLGGAVINGKEPQKAEAAEKKHKIDDTITIVTPALGM